MNTALQNFARQTLKDDLAKLPASNHRIFNLMYARLDGKRSPEEAEAMDVNATVDEMSFEKLDWAMQQVQASLEKLNVQNPS